MIDTAGRLDVLDTFSFLRQALVRRLAVRRAPRVEPLAMAEVTLPDTALTRWAIATCEAASAPWLTNHALRTWLWGSALARRDGARFDQELAFTACLLHDLGLTAAHLPAPGCCFAVHGGRAVDAMLVREGVSAERRARVAEAIARHLDITVGLEHGEARVVHEGAACDVIGARFREFAPVAREQVLQRHPRLGFKGQVTQALVKQVRNAPSSRIAWLFRLGFRGLIAGAPFTEEQA